MLVSATSFDVQLLKLIWQSAFILSVLAMLVPVSLIIKRKLEDIRERRRGGRHEELSNFLRATLRSPVEAAIKNLPDLEPGEEVIVMRIALDILRVMRGGDRERIIHILQRWNLFAYLRTLSARGSRGKRIQALTLLGYFDTTESFIVLMDHAASKDMYVQLAALRGLAERGVTKYIGYIIEKLQKTRKTNILMLADVLGRFGEKAIPSLITLLQSTASADVRAAAIMAMDRIGALEAVPPLINALNDSDPEIRSQAANTLGKLGDIRAGAALTHCLEDKSEIVRLQAASALGQLSYPPALPSLVKALGDRDWWIGFRAAQALYKSGNNGIAMLKALSLVDNAPGLLAAQVLGEMGGSDARVSRAA